jgi:MFS family permease
VTGGRLTNFGRSIGANRLVVALSAARLGDGLGNSVVFILLPLYVAQLPSPLLAASQPLRAGFLISWYGLVGAVLQPFTGVLIDRFNRRKLFIQLGLIFMGLGTLCYVLAGRFVDLLLLRTVQAVGLSMTVPGSVALLALSTERRTRGGAMSIFTTARMLGLGGGPLLGGYLYDHYGFHPSFFAGAAFILVAIVLVQLWVREAGVPHPDRSTERMRVFDRRLLSPGIVAASLAVFVMASAFSMLLPLETQFNRRLGQGALAFGLAFSAVLFSRLLFQIPLGRLSDRVGRKPVIIAGLLLMAPTTALLGEAGTTLQLVLLRLVQGLGAAAVAAPALALAGDLAAAGSAGRQMSITTIGFGLGVAVGPLLAGALSALRFGLPFWVAGAMLAAGAWVVARIAPETAGRD